MGVEHEAKKLSAIEQQRSLTWRRSLLLLLKRGGAIAFRQITLLRLQPEVGNASASHLCSYKQMVGICDRL
ncbi:MAG TPA: hypothetical protein V6D12_04640 [Candidatus Obscuribacterales bacterium]